MKTRNAIISEARRIRAEIEQIFTDCAHWNDSVRKPEEPEIDTDPDGTMMRVGLSIDSMLVSEGKKVDVTCPACGSQNIQKINGRYTGCLECSRYPKSTKP